MRRKFFYQKATTAIFLIFVVFLGNLTHAAIDEEFDDGLDDDIQDDYNGAEEQEEIIYESPSFDPEQFYFVDHFDDVDESKARWVKSQAKKDDIPEDIAKYDGEWSWESPKKIAWKNDIGLVLKSKAKHAAIAAKLNKIFNFKEQKPLVVQYEVQLQDGQECGGSYIKLLSHGPHLDNLSKFNDKTPYTIMFGPDKCGNDIKMHFIFRHVNPINGTITEKHCRKAKDRLEEPFKDKMPHLYQLVVRPDNTFEIRVDHNVINEGSLLTDFTPPVNPPQDIDDPKDKKPADWDEREKIPDPAASKPDDWDEDAPPQIPDPTAVKPEGWLDDEEDMIPDPSAEKPDDWDTEIDGDWEAPFVDNPVCEKAPGCGEWAPPLIPNKEYKGKWRAPLIDNPNYQGKWAPRKIPNPDYFEDLKPFQMTPIAAVGIELWSMSSEMLFDNLIITDDVEVAREFAAKSFDIKRKYIAKESDSFLNKIIDYVKEYPLAWKIGLVLLVAPLAFSFYTFMSKGGKKKEEADPKKTDAVQPDDPVEDLPPTAEAEDTEVNDAETEAEAAKNSKPDVISPTKPKKSDLDVKVEDEDFKNEKTGGIDDDLYDNEKVIENEDDNDDDNDDNENENENEAPADESPEAETTTGAATAAQKSSSARKRHIRKD